MDEKRVMVVISGWVQGVAFRANCQREASRRGIRGWVRNRWDGKVEALFEGPADAVDELVRWCHHGPPSAQVDDVQVSEAPPGPRLSGFNVRTTSHD